MNECRICKSKKTEIVNLSGYYLIHCFECDITYNKDIDKEEKIKEYYSEKYVLEKNELKPIQRYFHRLSELIKLMAVIGNLKQAPAKLLDVGCDKGFFIDFARHFGYEVAGVELSNSAREYTKKLNLNVYENLDSVNSKFDIVVMWHSLEHFPDPQDGLKMIYELLNDDGLLFIRVPDFNCFWRKVFKSKWIWFQPNSHYFHFSIKSLKQTLELNGFESVEIKSSRPNNCITLTSNLIANKTMKKYFGLKPTLKSYIYILYEYLTGHEIFAIIKKTQK